jgi:hypothetical protein
VTATTGFWGVLEELLCRLAEHPHPDKAKRLKVAILIMINIVFIFPASLPFANANYLH